MKTPLIFMDFPASGFAFVFSLSFATSLRGAHETHSGFATHAQSLRLSFVR